MAISKTVEMSLSASESKKMTKADLVDRVNEYADVCTFTNEYAHECEIKSEKLSDALKKSLRDLENMKIKLDEAHVRIKRMKASGSKPVSVSASKAKDATAEKVTATDAKAEKFWTEKRMQAWAEELAENAHTYKGKGVPGPMWSIAFQWGRNGKVSEAQMGFFKKMCVKQSAKIAKLYSTPAKKSKTA